MSQKNLWETISVLEQHMPLSKANVEMALGIELLELERNESFVQLAGTGPSLQNGVRLSKLSLMLDSSMNFGDKSAFAMELDGACLPIGEVRQHFGDLKITQHPRGHSLQETTVWSTTRSWGSISFAFKEERPDCLFRVSFRK